MYSLKVSGIDSCALGGIVVLGWKSSPEVPDGVADAGDDVAVGVHVTV
jgi:hypothetical protein